MLRILVSASLLTCVFDIFCTVKYADQLGLERFEQNPIAAVLIQQKYEHRFYPSVIGIHDADRVVIFRTADVSRLVLFKSLGLLGAVYLFEWCLRSQPRAIAAAVVVPVFVSQMWLLAQLLS